MNNNPIKTGSADDFSCRMRFARAGYDVAVESLRAQIRLLWAQGIITENAMQVLFQSVTDIAKNWTQTETNYYEMRNILDEYETQEHIKQRVEECGK